MCGFDPWKNWTKTCHFIEWYQNVSITTKVTATKRQSYTVCEKLRLIEVCWPAVETVPNWSRWSSFSERPYQRLITSSRKIKWIEKAWHARIGGLGRTRSLVVFDATKPTWPTAWNRRANVKTLIEYMATEDDMVYDASEDTKKLDESSIREIPVFQSCSELDFKGFIVWKTPNLKRLC